MYFGGAIQMAGQVQGARRPAAHALRLARDRAGARHLGHLLGHDVRARGIVFNLLDTPGHADFSEDTYRTLSAVDAAVMVIDAAKGIESQTRKLFEVCRLRDIPIITFINKIDREGHDPLALLDEISSGLALDLTVLTWPLGMGVDFRGVLDVHGARLLLPARTARMRSDAPSPSRASSGSIIRTSKSASRSRRWKASRCAWPTCRSSTRKRSAKAISRR